MSRQQTPSNSHNVEIVNQGLGLLAKIIAKDVYAQTQEGRRKDGTENEKS